MKYVVKLTKTVERTVIIDAFDDNECDKKLNNGEIEKEWIRNTNNTPSYGEWSYEFGNHYSVESADELITNADDLARLYGEDSADRLERALFKYTDCGMCAMWDDNSITLTGYVEGCDGEHPTETLYFPFTVNAFRKVRDKLEALADEMWHEWNDEREEVNDMGLLYNCEDGNDMGIVGCFDNINDAIFAAENNDRVKEIWSYKNVNGDMGDAVECVWKFQ